MVVGRDTAPGPCEAAWAVHFVSWEQRGLRCPRLHAVAGQVPGLALPPGLSPRCRELAFAAAIAELFVAWYGPAMLTAAIGEWDRVVRLVALVAADEAAD